MLRKIILLGGRLLIICLVAALALAGVYNLTDPIIKGNLNKSKEEALKALFPSASGFELLEQADLTSLMELSPEFNTLEEIQLTSDGGTVVQMIVQGYKAFSIMVGITAQGQVAGYKVLEHTETKGLGDRITSTDFMSQFTGVNTPAEYGKDGLEALSGATMSSKGVLRAINTAANAARQLGRIQ